MATSGTDSNSAPKKQSAKDLLLQSVKEIKRLKQKLKKYEQRENDPIAIVGIGCRYPGGIYDAHSFWEFLEEGRSGIKEMVDERWDMAEFYDPDPTAPGKMYTKWAAMLDEPERFDTDFFGISPREAETLDPQHRFLLECTLDCLEDAGYSTESMVGTRTGVYVGIASADYAHLGSRFGDPAKINAWNATGNAFSAAAGRISYIFGLQGPCFATDTACSSSLVALHCACVSLKTGETDAALVGGVNALVHPGTFLVFCSARMMSPTGTCKTFSDDADGYVRAEGVGIIMLKRLSDAEKAKDNIRAIIRSTAVNQDGKSQGMTAPNEAQQFAVIKESLEKANMVGNDVEFVEAHGTGTLLGDPIEISAIQNAYCDEPRTNALVVGSVKTNFGHAEAASGVAGLIKLALTLQKGVIPQHLNFNKPNMHIPWKAGAIKIPTETTVWPETGRSVRSGGLNSFAFTGTNVHVIAQSYEPTAIVRDAEGNITKDPDAEAIENPPALEIEGPRLIALSAKTSLGLEELVDGYSDFMEKRNPFNDLEALSYTTLTARDHHKFRLAFVSDTPEQFRSGIKSFKDSKPAPHFQGYKTKSSLKYAFFFPGQGAQYAGMGKSLYERFNAFRKVIDYCEEQLAEVSDIALKELLWGEKVSSLNNTEYTQIALFCLEYSLAKFWMNLGIKPGVLVGHSLGEYVAACIAGVFSLKDGLKIICARGRLMDELTQKGSMVVISADYDTVLASTEDNGSVCVAAVNGDDNVVIAGTDDAVTSVVKTFEDVGISCLKLDIVYAFHSKLMEPMVDAFRAVLEGVSFHTPRLSIYSNANGEKVSGELTNVDYWVDHLLHAVRFDQCCESVINDKYDVAIEVGPGNALLSFLTGVSSSAQSEHSILNVFTLKESQEDKAFLSALAKIYTLGEDIDWNGLCGAQARERIHLPNYPFQRKVCWSDAIRLPASPETLLRASDEILFEVKWQDFDLSAASRIASAADVVEINNTANEHWLIFTDEGGVGDHLSERLNEQGASVSLVSLQSLNGADGKPDVDQYHQLFLSVATDKQLKIVYLSGLDFTEEYLRKGEGLSSEYQRFTVATETITSSLLYVSQAMQGRTHCTFWMVSENAITVGEDNGPLNSPQFIMNGFAKTLKLELAGSFKAHIDISSTDVQNNNLLIDVLQSPTDETSIAVRDCAYLVPRLEAVDPFSESSERDEDGKPVISRLTVDSDATYLIIGGVGSIGFVIAEHLVKRGATNLVLASRRGMDSVHEPQTLAQIKTFTNSGIGIHLPEVDITSEESMSALLAELSEGKKPLKGIIHSAGAYDITLTKDLDMATCSRVMDSKVKGAWLLDKLSEKYLTKTQLDFFIGFSSIASIWGSAGNYQFLNQKCAILNKQGFYSNTG